MKKIFYETPGLFISISQKSGMFGTIIHNAGFTALNLNYFYKAFAVNDLEGAIQGIRSLGIKGCSVSMPFKEDVIKFLDNETLINLDDIFDNNEPSIGIVAIEMAKSIFPSA